MTVKDRLAAAEPADVVKLRKQLKAAESAVEQSEREARALQKAFDHQQARLEHQSRKIFQSPTKRTSSSKHFNRVLVPDSHGAHIDEAAAQAFLGDLERIQPAEVVWMGDHLDCGGFLAQHHTMGFVAEADVEFEDDIDAANQFMDAVQKRTPNAVHHVLTGNHEHRIERWCITQSLGKQRTAQRLLDALGMRAVLHLDKRGWHYHPRGEMEQTHGRVRGAIKLGNCYFVHDVSIASDPCSVALNRYACNVAFGDTHRLVSRVGRKAEKDIFAATVGYLAKPQPYWQETRVTDWSHGYGLQIVANENELLHINVPIVGAKSLLGPLLGKVK
jgi:hypothetical protein